MKLAKEFVRGTVCEANITVNEFLVEDRSAKKTPHLLLFNGIARRSQDVSAPGKDGAGNLPVERGEKPERPFFKGKNRVPAPQLNAIGGSDAIHIGGVYAERLDGIVQLMRRSFRGWKDCRRQETPKRKRDCPHPHVKKCRHFRHGGTRRSGQAHDAGCMGGRTAADTIVLKNGRRIIALSAIEEGDKVKYLTTAGELSLPKSIVDHIERSGGALMAGTPGADAANLTITPPAMESSGTFTEVEHSAVHDGSIDREYIAKLESAARSGGRRANLSAALGHHAAANYELTHGDMEHALIDARTALTYAPEEPVLLMNVGFLLLRRSEFKESLEYLERARRFAPDNADVPKLEGWAYYGLNKLDQAVAEWKHALAMRPDKEVQGALEKALADKNEEESYKENESSHFKLRYSGAAAPALARDVLRTLERHFSEIESELNFTPPESKDSRPSTGNCRASSNMS